MRELARSQGFPDNYKFAALDEEIVTVRSSPLTPTLDVEYLLVLVDASSDRERGPMADWTSSWARVRRGSVQEVVRGEGVCDLVLSKYHICTCIL